MVMHCPECNGEYKDGTTACADCQVELEPGPPVDEADVEEEHPDVVLECVYETGDAAQIPLVKSLLEEAEIEYVSKGEPIQDLFGMGRFGGGLNYAIGPVQFLVRQEDAETARELLAHLSDPVPDVDEDAGG